jgi:hypothetical protein
VITAGVLPVHVVSSGDFVEAKAVVGPTLEDEAAGPKESRKKFGRTRLRATTTDPRARPPHSAASSGSTDAEEGAGEQLEFTSRASYTAA